MSLEAVERIFEVLCIKNAAEAEQDSFEQSAPFMNFSFSIIIGYTSGEGFQKRRQKTLYVVKLWNLTLFAFISQDALSQMQSSSHVSRAGKLNIASPHASALVRSNQLELAAVEWVILIKVNCLKIQKKKIDFFLIYLINLTSFFYRQADVVQHLLCQLRKCKVRRCPFFPFF